MSKKGDDGKIGGIKGPKGTTSVESTDAVGNVGGVKATSSVGAIGRAGSIGQRRGTRTMTLQEREELFKMINEEADKMFKQSGMPPEKQRLVADAVKMAVDSGLIDDEDDEEDGKKG